jgi:hypothetical protein
MICLVCNEPSDARLCPACAALEYAEVIRRYCAHATSTSPLDMAQAIMAHPKFPVAGQAHHPLVAAVLVTAWRNATGADAADRIDAAIQRGNSIPGGFCAGFGADAAAIACGIAVSVIEGNTIKAVPRAGGWSAHSPRRTSSATARRAATSRRARRRSRGRASPSSRKSHEAQRRG